MILLGTEEQVDSLLAETKADLVELGLTLDKLEKHKCSLAPIHDKPLFEKLTGKVEGLEPVWPMSFVAKPVISAF